MTEVVEEKGNGNGVKVSLLRLATDPDALPPIDGNGDGDESSLDMAAGESLISPDVLPPVNGNGNREMRPSEMPPSESLATLSLSPTGRRFHDLISQMSLSEIRTNLVHLLTAYSLETMRISEGVTAHAKAWVDRRTEIAYKYQTHMSLEEMEVLQEAVRGLFNQKHQYITKETYAWMKAVIHATYEYGESLTRLERQAINEAVKFNARDIAALGNIVVQASRDLTYEALEPLNAIMRLWNQLHEAVRSGAIEEAEAFREIDSAFLKWLEMDTARAKPRNR